MFSKNDKLTLTAINFMDGDGKILPIVIPFPLKDKKYDLSDVKKFDVFEYNEGMLIGGKVCFSVFIGETCSIAEICEKKPQYRFKFNVKAIKRTDDKLCYYVDENNVWNIFGVVGDCDYVLDSVKEAEKLIKNISAKFKEIKDCVSDICT